MIPPLYLRDIRRRVRDALAAWTVLTLSALVLTAIAMPIALWTDRPEMGIGVGFVIAGPIAALVLWRTLSVRPLGRSCPIPASGPTSRAREADSPAVVRTPDGGRGAIPG